MSGLYICHALMDLEIVGHKIILARQCVISKTQVHISKVKVKKMGQSSKWGIFCVLAKNPSCVDGF